MGVNDKECLKTHETSKAALGLVRFKAMLFYTLMYSLQKGERNMIVAMSPQEMEDFLSESNIARIATVKPDNSPHVTPVWYLWENKQLLIEIIKGSVKERNIRQNNKVAVTIDSNTPPSRGVIIEGTAEIEEEISEDVERRIFQRYLKAGDLEKYLEYAHRSWQLILIRILPERIITWDYSKNPFLNQLHRNR